MWRSLLMRMGKSKSLSQVCLGAGAAAPAPDHPSQPQVATTEPEEIEDKTETKV